MNLTTGVFTAPKNGVYHFYFSGFANRPQNNVVEIFLRLNGNHVAMALGDGRNSGDFDTAFLHSTLKMKQEDQVDLYLYGGSLRDQAELLSHFAGWLDEEELQL